MSKALIVFVAIFVVAVCQGTQAPERHGNLNSYYIYTRDNPREPIQLFPTMTSIIVTPVRYRLNTAVIVHGHGGSGFSSLNPVVKDAFLTSEDMNVIVIDWSVYASQRYSNAVNAVPSVGVALAEFLNMMFAYNRVSPDRLHLVGFDLGAHVIGFTGRTLHGIVARITGLDPAASQWGSKSQRIRESDAVYVEVIHTDGDGLTSNGIGTDVGHVDFFMNGGGNQPGCLTHSCSHDRAWQFFAASLTHNHLIGNQCTSNMQISLNTCRGFALAMGNNQLVKYGAGRFRCNTKRTYPY